MKQVAEKASILKHDNDNKKHLYICATHLNVNGCNHRNTPDVKKLLFSSSSTLGLALGSGCSILQMRDEADFFK